MGWDAYAEPFNPKFGLLNADCDPDWLPVYLELINRGITQIDGLLKNGGLDVSTCGLMLQAATGESVYGDSWDVQKVRKLARKATWDFEIDPRHEWARESARAFLEHAAKLGKSIRFSW